MRIEGYYRTRFRRRPGQRETWGAVARWLQRYIPPDGRLLELGAGYCHFINQVRAARKTAVDIAPGLAGRAGPGVTALVGPAAEVMGGFRAGSFDVVFASNFLEHLEWPGVQAVVSETRRVLAPGGRFILIQPNFRFSFRDYFDDYTHRTIFTEVALADFLAAEGFRPEKVIARFLPMSFRCRLPRRAGLVSLYLRSPVRPGARQMLVVARKEANVA